MKSSRGPKRRNPERRKKKIFTVVTEGRNTEPEYFRIFKSKNLDAHINLSKRDNKSAPKYLLQEIKRNIERIELKSTDEAWIVLDRDRWGESQLNELFNWAKNRKNCHIAISNPSFEFWLLLHFEEGNGVNSRSECETRLSNYLNREYKKSIDGRKFTPERISTAIDNAKKRYTMSSVQRGLIVSPRQTTVYKLVESIHQGRLSK